RQHPRWSPAITHRQHPNVELAHHLGGFLQGSASFDGLDRLGHQLFDLHDGLLGKRGQTAAPGGECTKCAATLGSIPRPAPTTAHTVQQARRCSMDLRAPTYRTCAAQTRRLPSFERVTPSSSDAWSACITTYSSDA